MTSEDLFDQVGESVAAHHDLLFNGVLVLLNIGLRKRLVFMNVGVDIVLGELERFLGPHVNIGVFVLRGSDVVLGDHGRDGRAELVPTAGRERH